MLWEYSFNPAECLIRLRVILKGLILRRRKTDPEISDVIKLTKKIEETKELVFSESEKQDYLALEANYQKEFHKIARNDSDVRSNYLDILILIHYLRLACCHPIFLKKLLEKSTMGSADKIVPLRSASSVLSNKKLKLLENQENHCRICKSFLFFCLPPIPLISLSPPPLPSLFSLIAPPPLIPPPSSPFPPHFPPLLYFLVSSLPSPFPQFSLGVSRPILLSSPLDRSNSCFNRSRRY